MKSRPARKMPMEIWKARKAERDDRARLKRDFFMLFLKESKEFINKLLKPSIAAMVFGGFKEKNNDER